MAHDDDDTTSSMEWFCNHDVPNGCADCAFIRREAALLDAMSERERADYLYDGGTFETYFAPYGPAWEKEQEERAGRTSRTCLTEIA